jgi:hypothetical protein
MRSLVATNLATIIIGAARATTSASAKSDPEPVLPPMDMGAWRAWAKGASPAEKPVPSTSGSPARSTVAARAPQG